MRRFFVGISSQVLLQGNLRCCWQVPLRENLLGRNKEVFCLMFKVYSWHKNAYLMAYLAFLQPVAGQCRDGMAKGWRFGTKPRHFGTTGKIFGTKPRSFGTKLKYFGTKVYHFALILLHFGTKPRSFGTKLKYFGTKVYHFASILLHFGTKPHSFGTKLKYFGTKVYHFASILPHFGIKVPCFVAKAMVEQLNRLHTCLQGVQHAANIIFYGNEAKKKQFMSPQFSCKGTYAAVGRFLYERTCRDGIIR